MKKLWVVLLAMVFMVVGAGTALAKSPVSDWDTPYTPDFELVFKGSLSKEYLDQNSICFMLTKNGAITNIIGALIKYEFTSEGMQERIRIYKKNNYNSPKYDNFSYSHNFILYDLDNNKYTVIRFIDFDKSYNIIDETTKSLDNLRWSAIPPERAYTIDVIKKYIALNYDVMLSRSEYIKKSE